MPDFLSVMETMNCQNGNRYARKGVHRYTEIITRNRFGSRTKKQGIA
ncbi:hypothetical protein AGRO_4025 [Agrobacterium sp. ATCC 31749]|nr:hypothetical protein AGRO_4025 [Agrobacterium sp. ATCC 31749]